jgi:glucokinase
MVVLPLQKVLLAYFAVIVVEERYCVNRTTFWGVCVIFLRIILMQNHLTFSVFLARLKQAVERAEARYETSLWFDPSEDTALSIVESFNMLLAGDIGGTKTNLAIFSSQTELRTPLREATFPSAHYPGLEKIVHEFLSGSNIVIERACFGVPGPVIEGKARITNLPWLLQEAHLQEKLHIPSVRLLNDLSAMAYAIPLLEQADLCLLNSNMPETHGPLAVVAPGTGLGEAFLTWDGSCYHAYASEGGHADFAPTNQCEIGLLRYLLERFEHVSYEQVCSGLGIPHIYAYLQETSCIDELPAYRSKFAEAGDITPIILQAATDKQRPSPLCVLTLKMFASILGAEAGNLALKVLATGGVYFGGGIPPRILSFLKEDAFMQAFKRKGRLSEFLSHIPVYVILNPKVPLMGAAYYGFEK